MASFAAVWSEIQKLLPQGLSIIPVRDKPDDKHAAKTPYPKWKEYQSRIMHETELFNQLEQFNTSAIAIICGKISGNLEVIDVDVKNEPGIDAILFDEIRTLYPNLWHSLRIHKSPSGGFHILYRTLGAVPGNRKLAGRPTTQEEKEKYAQQFPDKKKPVDTVNFIETRGEGGYVLAPPSLGYSVFKDTEIPVLTWEERCSLINICISLNRIPVKPKSEPKQSRTSETMYDEDPFADFNARGDLLQLMQSNGWSYVAKKGDKIWLTKPGGKNKHVHGAIFTDNNVFYCFTTGTDFVSNEKYKAVAVLCFLQFNDDWKQCYRWLVDNGYGKLKPKIESDLIRKNKVLPGNASASAIEQKQQHDAEQKEVHPYGVFWLRDEKDKLYISREHLYQIAESLGFINYEGELYQILHPFIHKRTEREFYDICKSYIKEDDGDIYIEICNTYEAFLQKSGKFSIDRIKEIDAAAIAQDTRVKCNKFFTNCYLEITAQKIEILPYEQLQQLVFYSRIQQREFQYFEGGVYPEFLKLALGEISENTINTIGYLSHEYKDETTGYIIVLVEKVADPKMGGGSGKNLFCSLLQHTTTFISRPGSGAKFDEKFFQVWKGQKIFSISDVDENFNFLFLKEPATGHILWKRLFKDEQAIDPSKAPKLIVQTNYSYEVTDGGLARRIKPIEFTDYFTNSGGVDVVFGKHFTDDWTQEDWNGFDTFIANSVKSWLGSGRKLNTSELSYTGWEKQFIQSHKQTTWDIIQSYWSIWIKRINVTNERFKSDLQDFYNENGISERYRPSIRNINKALQEYAAKQRVKYDGNCNMRDENGIQTKGKKFGNDDFVTF